MKKLLLIALITFGAPANAENIALKNCTNAVNDLIGLHLADAPSIAYEYYGNLLSSWLRNRYLEDEAKDIAGSFIGEFWFKLGKLRLAVENNVSDDIDYDELRNSICNTGITIFMFEPK